MILLISVWDKVLNIYGWFCGSKDTKLLSKLDLT